MAIKNDKLPTSAEKLYDIEMSRVIVGIKDVVDRYVAAILVAASELDKSEVVAKDFASLKDLLESSPKIIGKISSPIFSQSTKVKAIEAIAKHLKLSELTKNFLLLLMKNNRLNVLDVMVNDFFIKRNRANGISDITVILAQEIDSKAKKEIQKKLTYIIKGELQVDYELDPSIMGGVIIKCGSVLFDASIEGKLNRLKKETNEQILNMQ